MLQPHGYEIHRETDKVCKLYEHGLTNFSTVVAHCGLRWSSFDHSIFIKHSFASTIIFAVYVDDIVVTEDDHQGIVQLKAYLSFYFHIKKP